jgi:seryl-tRNA synthetase
MQFQKAELVNVCTVEDSDAMHEEMAANCEAVLQALELPYRKVKFRLMSFQWS